MLTAEPVWPFRDGEREFALPVFVDFLGERLGRAG